MKIDIQPSEKVLGQWIEEYVPEKDFFFIPEKHIASFENELREILLIPRNEFFNHSSYSQIQLVNSYEYWNVSKEADFVAIANAEWIVGLPKSKRELLLSLQLEMNRGLIFPISYFPEDLHFLSEHTVKKNGEELVVLYAQLWKSLPYSTKAHLLEKYSQEWDEWVSEEVPEELPAILKKYVNTFPTESGSNCLAATIFAMTQQEWMLHEWIHPQTFIGKVHRTHRLVEVDKLIAGDVAVWEDGERRVQHASYHIGQEIFFNKSGQTFFNPWKLIRFTELQEEWKQYSLKVYRMK